MLLLYLQEVLFESCSLSFYLKLYHLLDLLLFQGFFLFFLCWFHSFHVLEVVNGVIALGASMFAECHPSLEVFKAGRTSNMYTCIRHIVVVVEEMGLLREPFEMRIPGLL
jgi:hypothetical protein